MPERLRHALRSTLVVGGVAVLYFLSARLLIALSAPPNGTVLAVWLPSGISVAAMLVFGPIAALGALAGSAVFELSMGTPSLGAIGMAAVNAVSELAIFYMIVGRARRPFALERPAAVLRFAFATGAGAALSATLGVLDYLMVGLVQPADWWPSWVTFFGSVVMGVALLTPCLVYAVRRDESRPHPASAPEFLLTTAAIAAAAFLWQSAVLPPDAREPALLLAAPSLLLAAFRFSPLRVSLVGIAFATASLVGATGRLATGAGAPPFSALFSLQFMTAGIAMIGYMLFAMVAEQNRANDELRLASTVFENSNEGIIITRPDGTIVDVNDACTRIHGRSRESMLGHNPRVTKSDRHPPEFYREMWRSLVERGEWRGEVWDRRGDGSIFPKLLSISAVKDARGKTDHYVGVFSDITGIKLAEEQLRTMATHDALTGLPNRTIVEETLTKAIARARRDETQVALMFFDIDNFKNVNDTLGHVLGDDMLVEVSRRLSSVIRESDMAARQGGDEFIVVIPDIEDLPDVEVLAERIREAVRAPYDLEQNEARVTASIGVAVYPADGDDPVTLIKHADLAMYRAKALGRDRCEFFSAEMQTDFRQRVDIERGLRKALKHDELFLVYQPQVDLTTGRVDSVEALVRWRTADGRVIGPDEFIPIAEETGLIVPLGEWVLRRACDDIARLRAGAFPDLAVAVNVSACQVRQLDIARLVRQTLETCRLAPDALEIEVTETALMYDPEAAAEKLAALRHEGVRVSLDDFGTGYSSLKYLRLFCPDRLKVDRFFVQRLPGDADSRAIVTATLALARTLGIDTVAEGPETEEQVVFLRAHGCAIGQGFHFSRPLPLDELVKVLAAGPFALPDGQTDEAGPCSAA